MELLLVGVSHRTAPVETRERVAFAPADLAQALPRAAALGAGADGRPDAAAGEAMIVSTCNRVELYLAGAGASPEGARRRVAAFLAAERGVGTGDLEQHLYCESGAAALTHLFRVAASLDSVVVGEPQILGQVKDAFEAARQAGTIGSLLAQIVPRAFSAAKRVRSETEIARSSASVASAVVDLSKHIFGDLVGREVMVLGAGEMGELAARHLLSSGCGRLHVVNRTPGRGAELIARLAATRGGTLAHGAEAHGWEALPQVLLRADVVVCATGAPTPVLTREMVRTAMRARRGRWLCLLDIAVPRDVERAAGTIDNVYLHDVDALTRMVDEHMAGRRREAEAAERIVAEEVERCHDVLRALGVTPTLRALRERFAEVARAEAQRTLARLGPIGERERRAIEMLADGIVNKLLHQPLTAIKREAESPSLLTAVRTLFDLPAPDADRRSPGALPAATPAPVTAPAPPAPAAVAGAVAAGGAPRVKAAAGGEDVLP